MTQWSRLSEQLEDLQKWEQRKRRERLLMEACVYAILAALASVPLRSLFPSSWTPLALALLFFILISGFFLVFRQREKFVETLNRLDRELKLQERVLTAWEILCRRGERPAETLVLEEADSRLTGISFRSLFKRRMSWHAYAAPVLLVALLLTPWLPVGAPTAESAAGTSLAQQIKELAAQMKQESREKELAESLRVAQELEEVAEKKLRGESDETGLRYALGAVIDSMEDVSQALPVGQEMDWGGLGEEKLSQLQERLRELRNQEGLPASLQGRRGLLDELGLATLDRRPGSGRNMSGEEIKQFLDRMAQEALAEQERRSLARTRELVSELLLRNPQGSGMQEFAGPGVPDPSDEPGAKRLAPGSRPGDAPGRAGVAEAYDPAFRAKVRSHLQGLLGEGPSRGFVIRGEARARESVVPQDEVVVRYERQIEEQLSSEKIPADFKDTIKNYFLSLGVTQNTP